MSLSNRSIQRILWTFIVIIACVGEWTRVEADEQTTATLHQIQIPEVQTRSVRTKSTGTIPTRPTHTINTNKPIEPAPITSSTHSVSLPGVSASEVAVRLLLNDEVHMAEAGPRLILGFGRFIAYTIFTLIFTLWWVQGSLLYMPSFGRPGESKQTALNSRGFLNPMEHNLPYEECWITSDDGTKTHAWLILQPAPAASPTIVFFHGNAGNIGYRLPNAKSLYYTTRSNILLVDYRGYGHSSGEPSEAGLKMDALSALQFLRQERQQRAERGECPSLDLSRIYLFGRSLGGAVAISCAFSDQQFLDRNKHLPDSALHPPLAGLLLENTFCNLVEMVLVLGTRIGIVPREPDPARMIFTSSIAGVWRSILGYLLTNHWSSLACVKELRVPMLFLSGLADELIPASHSAGLYDAAEKSAERHLYTVPNGTHNDTFIRGGMQYYQAIFEFMQRTQALRHGAPRDDSPSQKV